MTTAELLQQARKLSREDQLKLAHDLWIEAGGPYADPAEVETEWATEIDQRLQGIAAGGIEGVPHSEIRQRFAP